jgi:hypothetical protein
MNKLNKQATEIFRRLIASMNGKQHLKIKNEPYMPLTIEQIGQGISTPFGTGTQYSLCHYYEQNGDLMQDPEMCFIVAGTAGTGNDGSGLVTIIPYMFQQANLAIYQESIIIEDNRLEEIIERMQADHTDFANQWLINIKRQGFLK